MICTAARVAIRRQDFRDSTSLTAAFSQLQLGIHALEARVLRLELLDLLQLVA